MTSRRSALLVTPVLLVLLAGCGADQTPIAKDPRPASTGPASGEPGAPQWPTEGCETHSGMNLDYTSDAAGDHTLEKALAPYIPEGARVVKKRAEAHRNARYLAVNDDNEIVASVEAFDGGNGWLVGYVEKCSN